MTQEEKELLLKDLCARLPYSVKAFIKYTDESVKPQLITGISKEYVTLYDEECQYEEEFPFDSIRPYLRPMSSMTKEEIENFSKPAVELELKSLESDYNGPSVISLASSAYQIDFLNFHHFDYRGLIEKGLALEAPEGMYK